MVKLSMVTEAKDSYDVMLLPGDGIGPEITAATVNALEPLQSLFKLNFKEVCTCFMISFAMYVMSYCCHSCLFFHFFFALMNLL